MSRFFAVLLAAASLAATAAHAASGPSMALTEGDAEAGQQKSGTCVACHGQDGNSPTPMYPKIAGQHAGYIVDQLKAYKSGERENAVMQGMAAPLSEQDMKDLAVYYSTQEMQPGTADGDRVAMAGKIYRGGDKEANIPACIACHGPSGEGMPAAGFPAIGGQHADYTRTQLELYASGERQGPKGIMESIARRLSAEQIEALSDYLEGLHERDGAFDANE